MQLHDVHAFAVRKGGVAVGKHVELAAARAHFLQVRLQLVEERIARRDRHHWHVAVDKRKRAVL